PGSVCKVALSWIWERSPTSIHSLSPRSTAPHHTLASDLRRTRPITTAVSAIQYCPSAGNSGRSPPSSNIGIVALLKGDPCHVARALASRGQVIRRCGRGMTVGAPRGRTGSQLGAVRQLCRRASEHEMQLLGIYQTL